MSHHIFTRITDYVGHLLLHENGATIASSGELENDEKTSSIIFNLVSMTDKLDENFSSEGFNKISVCFEDFCYTICLSNKKIHVIKRRFAPGSSKPQPPLNDSNLSELQVSVSNSINT